MFGMSCECGYEECDLCGPHIEANRSQRRKDEIAEQKLVAKLSKDMYTIKMPWGKYKGTLIAELPPRYCTILLKHQRDKITDKYLVNLLTRQAAEDRPRRTSYSFFDIYGLDDFDPFDP